MCRSAVLYVYIHNKKWSKAFEFIYVGAYIPGEKKKSITVRFYVFYLLQTRGANNPYSASIPRRQIVFTKMYKIAVELTVTLFRNFISAYITFGLSIKLRRTIECLKTLPSDRITANFFFFFFNFKSIWGNLKKTSTYLHLKMLKIFFEGTPSRRVCSHLIRHNIYENARVQSKTTWWHRFRTQSIFLMGI